MFSISYLTVSLIFWDKFSAFVNAVSSGTDPCHFALRNKPALGLDDVLGKP